MIQAKPLQLPAFSPEALALNNRLFSGPTKVAFKVGTAEYQLAFTAPEPATTWGAVIYGALAGEDVCVFLHDDALFTWLAAAAGLTADELKACPTELAEAALTVWLDEAGGLVKSLFTVKEVSCKAKTPLVSDKFWHFSIQRISDGARLRGSMAWQGTAAPQVVLEQLGKLPSTGGWEAEKLPLRLALEVGETSLKTSEWLQAAVGDVIMVDEYFPHQEAGVRCRLGRRWVCAGVMKSSTTIESKGVFMAEPDKAFDPAEAEVRLVLELDARDITLREVQSWQPGYIVETSKPLAGPVTLKINGQAIGRGELVDVGGRVGVRLLTTEKP